MYIPVDPLSEKLHTSIGKPAPNRSNAQDFEKILNENSKPEPVSKRSYSTDADMTSGALDILDQMALYRDEQLRTNPGGKAFDYQNGQYLANSGSELEWGERITKDIQDATLNIKNFFLNSVTGAEKPQTASRETGCQSKSSNGLLGSIIDFVKDMGSALTLGMWRPDGEEAPEGVGESLLFAASKFKEAFGGDIVGGVGGSVVQMAEDLLLAGWNLTEAVPDTLLGMCNPGKVAVDTLFDNGQVAIDYITDIMPGGEAWMRVHAGDITEGEFPVLYNIRTPETFDQDMRWQAIRNTPFRKSIETLGSLLMDAAVIFTTGQGVSMSSSTHSDPKDA